MTQMNSNRIVIRILYEKKLEKWSQAIFLTVVITLLEVIFIFVQNKFSDIFPKAFILFLQTPKYIAASICLIFIIRFLWMPKYLVIDSEQGVFYYHYPFFKKKFYFAEVETVQMESDMSNALLRLNSKIDISIYLKLRTKKLLFISEFSNHDKSTEVVNQLQKLFDVELEKLHKVGRKRSKETNLGRYTIEKEISRGGMGKVFLAKDKINCRDVAIKVLPASLALKQNNATSFARETKILQRLKHPNIVQILNVGREKSNKSDVYFYAMECIEGKPLSYYIKQKSLSLEQSVRYVIQIALALDYIHSHKVVHRDIKPENIMIRDDKSCVLIDFGIASDVSVRHIKTKRNRVFRHQPEISHYIGTLPYMSPEQISSKHFIDYRTDIYSLGITFYEMLVNERVFDGNGQFIIFSILFRNPSFPSSKNDNIPKELDSIVMKSIAKDKHYRYRSGADLAEDLHRWLHKIPIRKYKTSILQKISRKLLGRTTS